LRAIIAVVQKLRKFFALAVSASYIQTNFSEGDAVDIASRVFI
jgi:hypothetical protein